MLGDIIVTIIGIAMFIPIIGPIFTSRFSPKFENPYVDRDKPFHSLSEPSV